MPRLSDTMEEGTIAAWLKQPGEQVNKGEVIAQIETDKATMDLTAFEAGTLQEILAPEGSTVAIGKPVARIGSGAAAEPTPTPAEGQAPAAAEPAPTPADGRPPGDQKPAPQVSASADQTPPPPSGGPDQQDIAPEDTRRTDQNDTPSREQTSSPPPDGSSRQDTSPPPSEASRQQDIGQADAAHARASANGKVRASPMARHIAAEHGLNLSDISGSGPQGRVVRADVEAALSGGPPPPAQEQPAAQADQQARTQAPPAQADQQARTQAPPPGDDERVPLSQMRRTIARRLAESKRTVPHFYLTTTVDATDLGALRKQINEQAAAAGIKVSFNDLIVKGAALAVRQVPEVNVSFAEDALIRHAHVHVGIAVATERGLIVPVVHDADQKSVGQISREARDLAERANTGKLQPSEYSGGTFSVSNLGMFGVEQFEAVINPPEAAILAVGAITREPAEHDGEIALRDRVRLTLSVDHRALDGAAGARYLQALKRLLENPMLLLL